MGGPAATCECGTCKKCRHRVNNRRSRARIAVREGKLRRRFPVEPLLRVASTSHLSDATDRRIYHYIARGDVGEVAADRIATELGYHPSEIWTDWFPEALVTHSFTATPSSEDARA